MLDEGYRLLVAYATPCNLVKIHRRFGQTYLSASTEHYSTLKMKCVLMKVIKFLPDYAVSRPRIHYDNLKFRIRLVFKLLGREFIEKWIRVHQEDHS